MPHLHSQECTCDHNQSMIKNQRCFILYKDIKTNGHK